MYGEEFKILMLDEVLVLKLNLAVLPFFYGLNSVLNRFLKLFHKDVTSIYIFFRNKRKILFSTNAF